MVNSAYEKQISELEKDLYYYKKISRELKRKLRQIVADSTPSIGQDGKGKNSLLNILDKDRWPHFKAPRVLIWHHASRLVNYARYQPLSLGRFNSDLAHEYRQWYLAPRSTLSDLQHNISIEIPWMVRPQLVSILDRIKLLNGNCMEWKIS